MKMINRQLLKILSYKALLILALAEAHAMQADIDDWNNKKDPDKIMVNLDSGTSQPQLDQELKEAQVKKIQDMKNNNSNTFSFHSYFDGGCNNSMTESSSFR